MKTSLIPQKQIFARVDGENSLNLKAICIFAATGFFLEKDTYYNNLTALQPATEYLFSEENCIAKSEVYWKWNYNPKDVTLKQATEEFAQLFEKITFDSLKNKKIILPLSGGLDSRSQAAALGNTSDVNCYSYKFSGSFDETKYGKEICKVNNYSFKEYIIPEGYLWNVINELSQINQCYADFTHPRQMAVINEIKDLGEIFYLGHWGDVLFDDMGIEDNTDFNEQTGIILKKILKKGGTELAEELWKSWGLEGNFKEYLRNRISELHGQIQIENANSAVRAFKSMYWAPRWTSANMNVFEKYRPVFLPYYSDEMCKFICNVPEELLSGRKIQIEYIKMKNPDLAEIPWQNYEPLNLYNFKEYTDKKNIPMRALKKAKKILSEKLSGKRIITRNWEIQFLGEDNDIRLKKYLFENNKLTEILPANVIKNFYDKFRYTDNIYYSHPLSMLLTLSAFANNIHPGFAK
ncbi:MAG: asparagine synthetase B family protein [Ignavibacteria bacterium]|nr:asparagine synthetase B family protein [Ignavibacteria bacterium]